MAAEQTKTQDKSPPGLASNANTHRHSEAKPATARASARCAPVTLTESCIGIKGRSASADLKGRILKALRESRIRLCAGERLLIGTGDAGARLLDGPDRLSSAPMKDFLIILGGYLDDNSRIGQIEISCTPH